MSSARKALKWPPIPKSIIEIGGEVRIVRQADPRDSEGDASMALWDAERREITLKSSLRGERAWLFYFHELTHAQVYDIGLQMDPTMEEALCQGFASISVYRLRRSLERAS